MTLVPRSCVVVIEGVDGQEKGGGLTVILPSQFQYSNGYLANWWVYSKKS